MYVMLGKNLFKKTRTLYGMLAVLATTFWLIPASFAEASPPPPSSGQRSEGQALAPPQTSVHSSASHVATLTKNLAPLPNGGAPVNPGVFYSTIESLPRIPMLSFTFSPLGKETKSFPRACVFLQRPYAWIVVDEAVVAPTSLQNLKLPSGYGRPEIVPHKSALIWRIQIPNSIEPAIDYDAKGMWRVSFGNAQPKHPFGSLPFLTKNVFFSLLPPAYVLLNVPRMSPITIYSEARGIHLIVYPTPQPGVGFPGVMRYTDFRFLQTSQGFVVVPVDKNRFISRVVGSEGHTQITQEGGLLLSPLEDRKLIKKTPSHRPYFSFDKWKEPSMSFQEASRMFEEKIQSQDKENHLLHQMSYARFFVAHGLGKKAQNILEDMAQRNSRIRNDIEFLSLQGFSYFFTRNTVQALKIFSHPHMPPEASIWRGASLIKLDMPQKGAPLMIAGISKFFQYPSPLKETLGLIAAEGCLLAKKEQEAEDILKKLGTQKTLSQGQLLRLKFLNNQLTRLKAFDGEGKFFFEKDALLRSSQQNPRELVAHDLEQIKSRLIKGHITRPKALSHLESLRNSWRGDDLEFKILQELARVYALEKDYKKSLLTFSYALECFPETNTPFKESAFDTFSQALFSNTLEAYQRIALFHEYEGLFPSDVRKTKLIQDFSEHIMNLGMPKEAAHILEEIFDADAPHTLYGFETTKRLAKSYIKDGQPRKAIHVITSYPLDVLSPEEKQESHYIKALGLFNLQKNKQALALLHNNQAVGANTLKIDVLWALKEWKEAAKALEKKIDSNPSFVPFDVLQLAMALYWDNNEKKLQKINNIYAKKMPPQHQELLTLLAQPKTRGLIHPSKIYEVLSQTQNLKKPSLVLEPSP